MEDLGLPASEAFQSHIEGCSVCRTMVADFAMIADLAREFPAEQEPPQKVWISLEKQLRAEGIIKEQYVHPELAAPARTRWQEFGGFFGSRSLASAALGLALAGAIFVQIRAIPDEPTTVKILPTPPSATWFAPTATVLNQQEQDLSNVQLASTSAVDTSLRQNLRLVDEFIADCERRVKEEPQDELAKEYLSSAYQQKAELLAAIMERGGSLN